LKKDMSLNFVIREIIGYTIVEDDEIVETGTIQANTVLDHTFESIIRALANDSWNANTFSLSTPQLVLKNDLGQLSTQDASKELQPSGVSSGSATLVISNTASPFSGPGTFVTVLTQNANYPGGYFNSISAFTIAIGSGQEISFTIKDIFSDLNNYGNWYCGDILYGNQSSITSGVWVNTGLQDRTVSVDCSRDGNTLTVTTTTSPPIDEYNIYSVVLNYDKKFHAFIAAFDVDLQPDQELYSESKFVFSA